MPKSSRLVSAVLVVGILRIVCAASASLADDRLRILLLDYNAPIEHDVLLSHLCVERCTRSSGCPDALVKEGVDFWNDDFAVFRPAYLGASARFVVQAYKDRKIDFLSISGHHASGFSGDFGKGRFYTSQLAEDLRDLPGRDGFFTRPSMVMLHGCWTDAKSGFDGDPIEYTRHIIEDTTVQPGESERLLAAIHQMAGEDDAYRDLFPNACILGYAGTQVPGGLLEIYGQVDNFLRGLRGFLDRAEPPASRFPLAEARRSMESMEQVNREVDRECLPRGWPCNLCRADEGYYRPLAKALAEALRFERRRIHDRGTSRTADSTRDVERALESVSLYANTSWVCSDLDPSTPPVYPEPIDRAPFVETFLELLMIDLGQIRGETRGRIEAELVHLLGATELPLETRLRLRARLLDGDGALWRQRFMTDTVPTLSTFRQRDFFDFLAEIGCSDCLGQVWSADLPRVVRENAASQLRPSLGSALYATALADPSARVRWLAASRMDPSLDADLFAHAAQDDDERVREAAAAALSPDAGFRTLAPEAAGERAPVAGEASQG